jgi:fructosamine-3-kinase
MKLEHHIELKVKQLSTGNITSVKPVSGGCISDAYKIEMSSGENYFLKLSYVPSDDMFIKEAHGLIELRNPAVIRVPKVLLYENSFILIEFINTGSKPKNFFQNFGRKFAELHKFKGHSFGFYEDNYIGSNVQLNIADSAEKNDWVKFFFNKRLLFQYKLAEKNDHVTSELTAGMLALEKKIDEILAGSEEHPSLLHGDLWGGNYLPDENGEPCLIDPAVYYGHREADLAMTKLFGVFKPEFYSAYNESYPLLEGYEYREDIYKLYHVLNHLNLFGSGYYNQAMTIIKSYLR